jgi:uncharacterized BrkB/YihY/UPF0761 family membrane protein
MTKSFVFTIVIIISLVLFFYNIFQFLKTLKIGKPENRFNQPLKRLKLVLSVAFGQSKILREPIPGIAHFLIFWGFIILLTAIIETLGEGLFPHFSLSFLGDFYPILATLQEVLILGVVIGVFIGLYRRLISKPKRLDLGKGSMIDASIILGIILFIIIGTLGQTASRIAASHPEDGRFLSNAIAPLIANVGNPELIGEFFWWMHIFLVLGFLN